MEESPVENKLSSGVFWGYVGKTDSQGGTDTLWVTCAREDDSLFRGINDAAFTAIGLKHMKENRPFWVDCRSTSS